MRILHENPEFYGAKRRFLPFLCIAKRVIVRSTPLFGGEGGVNSKSKTES